MAENSLGFSDLTFRVLRAINSSTGPQMNIHFWALDDEVTLKSLLDWDPDEEPFRFSSGLGHNVYELAVRLRNKGHHVTLGKRVPLDASLLVVFKKDFMVSRKNWRLIWHSFRRPVVHIRSDLQLDLRSLFQPDLEVMPNNKLVKLKFQKFIPPLPQRGLVPSRRNLDGKLVNICIKSNPQTFPDYLLEVAREAQENEATKDLVFTWVVPSRSDGSDHNWHNFSEVDVTLVLRNRNIYGHDDQRKPPTRLLNAWLAGTIPFIDPIESYMELATDRVDAIVITHPSEILTRLSELNENPNYREFISNNVKKQALKLKEFDVLKEWESELNAVIASSKMGIIRILTISCTSVLNSIQNFFRQRVLN